jgi:hypothetical protein
MPEKRPAGLWIMTMVGILLLLMLVLGQMMSFINYDFTVSLGLQEPAEMVTLMGVAVNKGFGLGDTIVYIPLLVAGLAGLWLRARWGAFAMAGALAITAYWPVVCFSLLVFARGTPGFNFQRFVPYGIILSLILLYALWGLWYLYKRLVPARPE